MNILTVKILHTEQNHFVIKGVIAHYIWYRRHVRPLQHNERSEPIVTHYVFNMVCYFIYRDFLYFCPDVLKSTALNLLYVGKGLISKFKRFNPFPHTPNLQQKTLEKSKHKYGKSP